MSTYVKVACALVILTFALFTWCLCRIAALSDRRSDEIHAALRRKQYPTDKD